jgi:hypothetical protein
VLTRRSLFAIGGAALLLNGCERVLPDGRFPLMEVMGAEPNLSNFRAALRSSGLASELFDRPAFIPCWRQPTSPGLARRSVSAVANAKRCWA